MSTLNTMNMMKVSDNVELDFPARMSDGKYFFSCDKYFFSFDKYYSFYIYNKKR